MKKKFVTIMSVALFLSMILIPLNFSHIVKAETDSPPTPDLSGLTLAHYWSCNNSTPADTDITISASTYNASAGLYTNMSFITDAAGNTYLKGRLKRYTPGTAAEEKIVLALNYNPGVKTISGKIKIPEQHGWFGEQNLPKMLVSYGSAGYGMVYFNLAPGGNDTLVLNNGTTTLQWDIPRIPRDEWIDFVFSADVDSTTLRTYIYFGGVSVTKSMSAGSTSMTYFNTRFACTDAKLNFTFYLDEVKWYNEYYSLPNYSPPIDVSNIYHKGWDWKDYVYVAERVDWNQTSSSDLDINNSIHYYNFFDYYANFTMKKAVVILNPDGLCDMTVDQAINRTLNLTKIDGVYFRIPYSISTGCEYARKISWNAKNNANGNKIIAISVIDASTVNNWTIYTKIKENATKYATLKVYPDVYFHDFDIVPWSSLDGAWIAALDGEGYALLNQTIEDARSRLGTGKDLGVFVYTHIYYGQSAGPAPIPHIRKVFEYIYTEMKVGKLNYAIALGPARFCNYPDHSEINTWFSKQMSASYNEDGTRIYVDKEEDGVNINISELNIPFMANNTVSHLEIRSNWSVTLEVEVPAAWDMNQTYVKDETTGKYVNWTQGSVIFVAENGHAYTIYEYSKYVTDTVRTGIAGIVAIFIPVMIISMLIGLVGEIGRKR